MSAVPEPQPSPEAARRPKAFRPPLPLTRLDRYIIGKFLVTYFFVFWVIMAIAIVIDVSEKMEDFLDEDFTATTWETIRGYYIPFVPWMGAILTPLLIFLSVIFFTSRMAFNTEIVAILSSGISFRRFLRPYLLTGLLLGGGMWYANHFLVPDANKTRLAFDGQFFRGTRHYGDNITLRLDSLTFVSLSRFKYQRNEGVNFRMDRFRPAAGGGRELAYQMNARRVIWEPDSLRWRFADYTAWYLDGLEERWETGKAFDTVLAMRPDDFEVDAWYKDQYDLVEMREFLRKERAQGSGNLEAYEVERERRTATAIAIVILTIMGATIASRKLRGGIGLHLAFGVGLSALYIVFLQFSSTFSIKGSLDPVIGANIPNLVFAGIALWLIRRAPK